MEIHLFKQKQQDIYQLFKNNIVWGPSIIYHRNQRAQKPFIGTSWNKINVPVSFSVGCNLEGVETEHQSRKDPGELLSQFVNVLMEMAKKKYEACVEHYEHIFIMMDRLLEREISRIELINPHIYTGDDLIKDKERKGDFNKITEGTGKC